MQTQWEKKKRELLAYIGRKTPTQDVVPLSYMIYIDDDVDFTIAADTPKSLQQLAMME